MSLCAQHSSRPFTDRLLRITSFSSSLLLFFFFGTIFEMHSQSSSTNLLRVHAHRVPGSRRITRRNSARLLYYRRSLKLPCSMPECYLSDLFLLNFCILQFFSFSSRNEPPAVKRIGHCGRDRSLLARPYSTALAINTKNHLLVCVYARFFWLSKKKEQSHTSRCAWQLHLPGLLLYHLTRFNAR